MRQQIVQTADFSPDIRGYLKSLPLFSACDEACLDAVMEGYSIERHNKGYIAFIYGEDAHRYYIIRRGWVKDKGWTAKLFPFARAKKTIASRFLLLKRRLQVDFAVETKTLYQLLPC